MYAVFLDDGLYDVYYSEDEANRVADNLIEDLEEECRKDSVYVKKLTDEEMKLFS